MSHFTLYVFRFIHVVACEGFPSLRVNNSPLYIYIYIYISHFVYNLIHQWTYVLLPLLSYYEQCYYEHGYANISKIALLSILIVYPEVGLLDQMAVLFSIS